MSKKSILHIFGNISAFFSVILSMALMLRLESETMFFVGIFILPFTRVLLMHRRKLSEYFKMLLICEFISIISIVSILGNLFNEIDYFYSG